MACRGAIADRVPGHVEDQWHRSATEQVPGVCVPSSCAHDAVALHHAVARTRCTFGRWPNNGRSKVMSCRSGVSLHKVGQALFERSICCLFIVFVDPRISLGLQPGLARGSPGLLGATRRTLDAGPLVACSLRRRHPPKQLLVCLKTHSVQRSQALDLDEQRSRQHGATRPSSLCHSRASGGGRMWVFSLSCVLFAITLQHCFFSVGPQGIGHRASLLRGTRQNYAPKPKANTVCGGALVVRGARARARSSRLQIPAAPLTPSCAVAGARVGGRVWGSGWVPAEPCACVPWGQAGLCVCVCVS